MVHSLDHWNATRLNCNLATTYLLSKEKRAPTCIFCHLQCVGTHVISGTKVISTVGGWAALGINRDGTTPVILIYDMHAQHFQPLRIADTDSFIHSVMWECFQRVAFQWLGHFPFYMPGHFIELHS
jgi:hypothetical protein